MKSHYWIPLFLALFVVPVSAQDTLVTKQDSKKWWRDYYQKVASEYVFCLKSDQEEKLQVSENAVLNKDWDTDIMLLIEAREAASGITWHYSVGRFNGVPLRLEHKGVDVWKVGWTKTDNPRLEIRKEHFTQYTM